MRLHNGRTFWQTTKTLKPVFVKRDIAPRYDAVIVGGGMSGALCAYTLAQEGLSVAILDKGEMGAGSTLANTGLLQFSNDIMLHQLMRQIGTEPAVRFYRRCREAVEQLAQIAGSLDESCGLIRRSSLYYASSDHDIGALQQEYEALSRYGFGPEYWTRRKITEQYPFSKPAALVTHGDAEVNPYLLNRGILEFLNRKGVHIFEHTEAGESADTGKHVELHTSAGVFRASHLIYATGYAAPPFLHDAGADLNRSYAIATTPVQNLSAWRNRVLIWETRRPYFYLRTTTDGRIIAGGLDEDKPETPHSIERIASRARRLLEEIRKLFPMLQVEAEYAWGAVFGESADNLPVIGRHPSRDRIYYLLGYGGNGTVYSMLGSHIIRETILGRQSLEGTLLQPGRLHQAAPGGIMWRRGG
jgi:glycine/D-amino acid oxidase-like deaminating enzyme